MADECQLALAVPEEFEMSEMTPDEAQAYIDQVCEEDDRLRAERARNASRRPSGAAPMQKSEPGELLFREQRNNALTTTAATHTPTQESSGGFRINRESLVETLGEVISDERWREREEVQQALAPLREDIVALRTEMRGRVKGLIELRGAFHIRGPYHADQRYGPLDVVTVDDRWYAARSDRPGACPGPDWEPGPAGCQGATGLRGSRGPRGAQGAAGKDAREWSGFKVDRENYSLTVLLADGSEGPTIPLRPLFEQFLAEVGE